MNLDEAKIRLNNMWQLISICEDDESIKDARALELVLKELFERENHVRFVKCVRCGKEFTSKSKAKKYCENCKIIVNKETNQSYMANLSEEQKAKRREDSKLRMRKRRAKYSNT